MPLIDLIRRHARRRLSASALTRAARAATGEWQAAEQAVLAAFASHPRSARGLVRAYGEVADVVGSAQGRGRSARIAGSFAAYRGDDAGALPHYERAADLLRGAARDGARLGTAAALMRLGRFDDARRQCAAVRSAARRRGDALLAAGADLNEGVARHEGGDVRGAIPLYERAAAAFAASGHAHLAATAAQNLGNALVLLDRHSEAAPQFAAAADGFQKLGLDNEAARCRLNRGELLLAIGRLGDADAELRAAERSLSRAGDTTHAAMARLDRAEVLLDAGLAAEAMDLAAGARRGMRRLPPVERERARLVHARAALSAGRLRSARSLLVRPVPPELRRLVAERAELRARIDAAAGHDARAATALRDVAPAHRRAGNAAAEARCLAASAWCSLRSGATSTASRLVTRAIAAADRLGLASPRFAAHAVAFAVADERGDRPRATTSLNEALAALEEVRDGLGPDALRSAVLRGREEWFARAVRHVLAGPDGEQAALALLERWRARALRDLLEGARRVAGGEDDVADLRARVELLERRLLGESGGAMLRAHVGVASPRALVRAERALRDALRLRSAERGAAAPDLSALRSRLRRGDGVLAFFADAAGSLLFLLRRDGLHTVRLPTTRADIGDAVDRLRLLLGQHELGPAFVERHAARIARRTAALLDSLSHASVSSLSEPLRGLRRLRIVPHGPWHHVPFAALPLDGRPLAEQFELSLAPALGAFGTGRRRARGRSLVVAVADEDAPQIGTEGRRVTRALGRAELLVGEQATLAALGDRVAPACLHVAAHGRHRPEAPSMSAVRLGDGWLRAADMATLPLRGSTVVLSGCETGASSVDAGDELQGLVRGVLAAGARELVASLWRVDDATSADLMVGFHRARSRGLGAAAALRHAQRSLARRGLSPWHWAPFQVWTTSLA